MGSVERMRWRLLRASWVVDWKGVRPGRQGSGPPQHRDPPRDPPFFSPARGAAPVHRPVWRRRNTSIYKWGDASIQNNCTNFCDYNGLGCLPGVNGANRRCCIKGCRIPPRIRGKQGYPWRSLPWLHQRRLNSAFCAAPVSMAIIAVAASKVDVVRIIDNNPVTCVHAITAVAASKLHSAAHGFIRAGGVSMAQLPWLHQRRFIS